MHILVIPSWYSAKSNPLRGSFFREQALALKRVGHQVGLLVPPSKVRTWNGLAEIRRGWRLPNTRLDVTDDAGMPTYRLAWWGWWPSLYPPARRGLALAAFDRYCAEQGRPEVIHAHGLLYGGYLAAHIRRARGVPAVLTEHSSAFVRRLIFPDQRRRAAFALRHMDKALALNAAQAAALRAYAPAVRVDLIPNSTNVEFFTLAPMPPLPFTFAVIAALNPNKGVDLLLKAFAAFRGQPVRLTIAGDGAQRDNLERLARALDIGPQVTFLGRVSREAVRDVLHSAHCVVSASYFEMLPLNLIEALACGRPIVATRTDGAQVLVNDSNGLLLPSGDVDALAAAMQQMRTNHARYDPAQIRAGCVARYSDAALARQLETVYHEVLNAAV